MQDKVLLGMSGGVDSSVAAILLKKAGYQVIGATMQLFEGSREIVEAAQEVCKKLEIPHIILDYQKEFKKYVIDNFTCCYNCGKTPNPCVQCNKYLKFGYFYKKAKELGCKYIATGHYAKIEYSEKYSRYVLIKSNAETKDQTYFLYSIPKEILKYILFPLSNYKDKTEIRKIAEESGLLLFEKPESKEICFIPDNDYSSFLIKNAKIKSEEGNIVLKTGEVLGKHRGLINYTIGQRKGLKIAYQEPLYVLELNTKTNELVVGKEEELYSNELTASNLNWLAIDKLDREITAEAKIRYRSKESECKILPQDLDKVKVIFKKPQRAITPGQSVVFYKDGIILGGGIIN